MDPFQPFFTLEFTALCNEVTDALTQHGEGDYGGTQGELDVAEGDNAKAKRKRQLERGDEQDNERRRRGPDDDRDPDGGGGGQGKGEVRRRLRKKTTVGVNGQQSDTNATLKTTVEVNGQQSDINAPLPKSGFMSSGFIVDTAGIH